MDTLLTDPDDIRRSNVRRKAGDYSSWAGSILRAGPHFPPLTEAEKESLEQLLRQLQQIGIDSEDPQGLLPKVPGILSGLHRLPLPHASQ